MPDGFVFRGREENAAAPHFPPFLVIIQYPVAKRRLVSLSNQVEVILSNRDGGKKADILIANKWESYFKEKKKVEFEVISKIK